MQRERTHRWDDYSELAREVTTRSGLEYLKAIVGEHHYNTIGTVHGSIIVAALDSAAGNAVHSTLPAGVLYTAPHRGLRSPARRRRRPSAGPRQGDLSHPAG